MTEICSKLAVTTAERRCSGIFIVNFFKIPHCSGPSIPDFEQVNAGCGCFGETFQNTHFPFQLFQVLNYKNCSNRRICLKLSGQ